MRIDSRTSRMLHVLLHMAYNQRPLTSEQIAVMLKTNPVVVRRSMAGLREAGYVRSVPGQGGGWSIACDLKTTTLLHVHRVVGGPHLFAIGFDSPQPSCAVERSVNKALERALGQAEAMLLEALGQITLAELSVEFAAACDAQPKARRSRRPPQPGNANRRNHQ